MPDITDNNIAEGKPRTAILRQLAWFAGLYCAGLLVTALVAYFFRALIGLI